MEEFLSLTDAEQETLLKRLTHYALIKMRRLTWRGAYLAKGGAVPGGHEAKDFALDAINKLLDGIRNWNKAAYPTLEGFLRSTIDSDISHLVQSDDNSKHRRILRRGEDGKEHEAYEVKLPGFDSVTIVIHMEWREAFRKAVADELKGDSFLKELFDCFDAEITEPSEIAEMLGATVKDVNNAKKRLRRKLEKLEAKFPPPKVKANP